MRVLWHFDPVSPFAWLALPAVERLAARRPVGVRPVVFGAILKHWGQLGPAEIAPKRLHTYRLARFLAERASVELRFPPAHPFRSLDALRLLATAKEPSLAAARAALAFVWEEGRDAADAAELAALRARLRAPEPDAAAKDRLRRWTEEALAAGVFGVPTLQIGAELFWGADAMPMAEAYLDDPGLLDAPEMRRLASLGVGVERAR